MAKSPSFAAVQMLVAAGPTANTEFSVAHDLGRTPVEAFLLTRLAPGTIRWYRGTTAWNETTIYLRASTTAQSVTLLLV